MNAKTVTHNTHSSHSTTRKPSRKALLAELESIHASLLDFDASATATTTINSPQSHASQQKQKVQSNEQDMPINSDKDDGAPTALPGQQSLFDLIHDEPPASQHETTATIENVAAIKKVTKKAAVNETETVENPFLPQHVKERLAKEKQYYQQELESIAKLSFGTHNPLSQAQCEQLIDSIVARYLPQIEQELRSELQKILEKEHEPS